MTTPFIQQPFRRNPDAYKIVSGESRWRHCRVTPAPTWIGESNNAIRRAAALVPNLSPREFDMLFYIAQGLTNKTIAAELHRSVKTIDHIIQRLMTRLHLAKAHRDRAFLTRVAVAADVVPHWNEAKESIDFGPAPAANGGGG